MWQKDVFQLSDMSLIVEALYFLYEQHIYR